MEIFFIIVLAIAVVWQFLAIIAYSSESDRKILEQERNYNELKSRLNQFRDSFNAGARRGNEHLRAFKELADLLGYCVHQEQEVKFDLASIFGEKEPKWSDPKLVVHKKEAVKPPRKTKVRSKK